MQTYLTFFALCDVMRPFLTVCDVMRPFLTVCDVMRPFLTVCDVMRPTDLERINSQWLTGALLVDGSLSLAGSRLRHVTYSTTVWKFFVHIEFIWYYISIIFFPWFVQTQI